MICGSSSTVSTLSFSFIGSYGQFENKAAADRALFHPNPSAMSLNDPANDREPKPKPFGGRVDAMKLFEDLLTLPEVDPFPFVFYCESNLAATSADTHRYRAAFW